MVMLKESYSPDHAGSLRARIYQPVILSILSSIEQYVAEELDSLADRAAQEQFTKDLVDVKGRESGDYQAVRAAARGGLKDMMEQMWSSKPKFAEAARQTQSSNPRLETFEWAYVPVHHSHPIICQELPADQVWIID